MLTQVRHRFDECVYVAWLSRVCVCVCVCVCVWTEMEAADTSLTSQLRQPVFLVLPWATQHPSALLNTLWLKEKSRFAKQRKLFLKAVVWQPFHTLQKRAWE